MVLMRVDLPEPDGPQITTTSPRSIWVLQSLSTWVAPYHLLTCLSSIMLKTFRALGVGFGVQGVAHSCVLV